MVIYRQSSSYRATARPHNDGSANNDDYDNCSAYDHYCNDDGSANNHDLPHDWALNGDRKRNFGVWQLRNFRAANSRGCVVVAEPLILDCLGFLSGRLFASVCRAEKNPECLS